jgi:hypothetical protein
MVAVVEVVVEGMGPVKVVTVVKEMAIVAEPALVIVVEPPRVSLVPRATMVIVVVPGEVSAAVSRRHACGAERDASGQHSHGNYSCCDPSDHHRFLPYSPLSFRYYG